MNRPYWKSNWSFERGALVLFLIAMCALSSAGAGLIARVPAGAAFKGVQLLKNGGFEQGEAPWKAWDKGFTLSPVAHSGGQGITCTSSDQQLQFGAQQDLHFDPPLTAGLLATAWSKAEHVTGAPDSGYSLYLDVLYADGSHLWGQSTPFSCASHDWEQVSVYLPPRKPIAELSIYTLFRNHTGTVWFDDVSLVKLPENSAVYNLDGALVKRPDLEPIQSPKDPLHLETDSGLALTLDGATGELCSVSVGARKLLLVRRGGFFVRDVAGGDTFYKVTGLMHRTGGDEVTFDGDCEELGLKVHARLQAKRRGIFISGKVSDTTGKPRALTLYFSVPVEAEGWRFCEETDKSPVLKAGRADYGVYKHMQAGAQGLHSLYPFCAIAGPVGLGLGVPPDGPYLYRGRYDFHARELMAAFDFGLLPDQQNFPGFAPFECVLFTFDPHWDFRGALASFYKLYPEDFARRTRHAGLWMPFTDIATVERPEDFYFAFHEGTNNILWDDEHDVLSFIYVEPVSYWMTLPKDYPRTTEAVLEEVKRRAKAGVLNAQTCLTSVLQDASGRPIFYPEEVPWASGGVWILNPDPGLPGSNGYPSQAAYELHRTQSAFNRDKLAHFGAWHVEGQVQFDQGRTSPQALKVEAKAGSPIEVSQRVVLNQQRPEPLIASAWSKAEGVTGSPDRDYSLYVDLTYTDGTHLYGQLVPFDTGTHDWQYKEHRITPAKPVRDLTVFLLLRGAHQGVAWFDDISLKRAEGGPNLLKDPGFETERKAGVLDGIYIDSGEMGQDHVDYDLDHLRYSSIPLTFAAVNKRPCEAELLANQAFARACKKWLVQHDKLLMANATPWQWYHLMPLLDVAGTETNWHRGQWMPDSRSIFNLRRALSYQKPYLLLQNTNFDHFGSDLVEKYFKRCTQFAVFPGFFSENAATKVYFGNPKLYNRDRPLFKRYLPVIIALQQAGWEPIPYARPSVQSVGCERYGSPKQGTCYLTLFNFDSKPVTVQVKLDEGFFGKATPEAVLGARPVAAGKATWKVQLAGEDVAVWRLK